MPWVTRVRAQHSRSSLRAKLVVAILASRTGLNLREIEFRRQEDQIDLAVDCVYSLSLRMTRIKLGENLRASLGR